MCHLKNPGDPTLPKTTFSLTVSRAKSSDVHQNCLDILHKWLSTFCIKFLIAFEVGKRAFNLHVQGVLVMLYSPSEPYVRKFVKLLKEQLPENGVGYRIVFKKCKEHQTFEAMIGYVTKDSGRPHYQYRQLGLTPQVCSIFSDFNTVRLLNPSS